MDLKKFAQIALKDVRLLLLDRTALFIIVLTPLILTFVIGAAFSGLGGGGSPVKNIPVVVVNQDKGTTLITENMKFGETLTKALQSTDDLLKVDVLDNIDEAKRLVREGKYTTAVLIPADFSDSLNATDNSFGDKKIQLTLFRDAGSPLSADIVAAVVHQVVNSIANVDISYYAAFKAGSNPLSFSTQARAIGEAVAANSYGEKAPIQVKLADVQTKTDTTGGFNLLSYFAPAMAVFFLNFAMAFGAATIIEERENGTLQRMLISPTNRTTILAGKLGGTYVNGLLQLSSLIIGTAILAPIFGNKTSVWGNNILALALFVLVVVAGSIGFGTLIAALARTRQQAQIYTSAILIVLGMVSGAFTAPPESGIFAVISRLTVNYWATTGFAQLAANNDITSILPNIAALLLIFGVCFTLGSFIFSRRLAV